MESDYILCEVNRCISQADYQELINILENSITVEWAVLLSIILIIITYWVTIYTERKNKKIKIKIN